MPQSEELDLAIFLEGIVVRTVPRHTYRRVTAAFPLPQGSSGANHYATAGSCITGQQMNGRGVQRMLHMSPRAKVAPTST